MSLCNKPDCHAEKAINSEYCRQHSKGNRPPGMNFSDNWSKMK